MLMLQIRNLTHRIFWDSPPSECGSSMTDWDKCVSSNEGLPLWLRAFLQTKQLLYILSSTLEQRTLVQ